MTNYRGGDEVKGGFYWNTTAWDATYVEGRQGVLAGEPSEQFVRVPVIAALLVAPIMGALFVIFLPFIGIALMAQHMLKATGVLASRRAERPAPMSTSYPDRTTGVDYEERDDINDRR